MKRRQFLGASALALAGLARGKLPAIPDPPVTWALMPGEGSFVFLDQGTLDFGIIRDSVLNATEDYHVFAETFESVSFESKTRWVSTAQISTAGTPA